jgi:hypothetical protein
VKSDLVIPCEGKTSLKRGMPARGQNLPLNVGPRRSAHRPLSDLQPAGRKASPSCRLGRSSIYRLGSGWPRSLRSRTRRRPAYTYLRPQRGPAGASSRSTILHRPI